MTNSKEKAGKLITSRLKYCGDPYGTRTRTQVAIPVVAQRFAGLSAEMSVISFVQVVMSTRHKIVSIAEYRRSHRRLRDVGRPR